MLGGSKKQARAARENNAACNAERRRSPFYVAVHQTWMALKVEVQPTVTSVGFAEITEEHIGWYLGYPSVPETHAGVARGDERPRLMQGVMVLGYLWRLAEERVGPAAKPLSDAQAVELASMLWDSEVTKKASDLWVSMTFAWIGQQGFRRGTSAPVFACPIAKDGFRSVEIGMQERLDYVWDEDGTYAYAFNFGYCLRYLEDASHHAFAHPDEATGDEPDDPADRDDDPQPTSPQELEVEDLDDEEGEFDAHIERLKARIAARTSPDDRFCTRCDSPTRIEGQFCGSCGARAPAPPIAIHPPDRYCGSCGRARGDGARFCTGCGSAFSS